MKGRVPFTTNGAATLQGRLDAIGGGFVMLAKKFSIAAMTMSVSLLMVSPAFAQSVFITIDADGNVRDMNGLRIKQLPVVTPERTIYTQSVVAPLPLEPVNTTTTTVVRPMPMTTVTPAPVYTQSVISPFQASSVMPQRTVVKKTVTTTTTPTFSTVVTPDANLSGVLIETLHQRRNELERLISLVDPMQSGTLRQQLALIDTRESAMRSGGVLSFSDAVALATDMDTLNNQLFMINQSNRLSPLVIIDNNGGRQIAVTGSPIF